MTAIVLGGQGFLGRHVMEALVQAGACADLGPPIEKFDLRTVSVTDIVAMLRSFDADVVVNATGQISGTLPDLLRGNAAVAGRLVDACVRMRPGMRLVHLGSAAEYGPTPPLVPIAEGTVERPVTPYGVAKLAASHTLLDATARGDVDAVVLRVFNPLGAQQPVSSLPGRVAAQLSADRDADITVGSLHAVRDFVSARDIGRAVAVAALADLPHAGSDLRATRLVNVGSGVARSVREVVELLCARGGHRGRLIQQAGEGSARSVDVDGAPADVRQAQRLLGWGVQDQFEDAVDAVLSGASPEGGRGTGTSVDAWT